MNDLVGDRDTIVDSPYFRGDYNNPMTELMLATRQI